MAAGRPRLPRELKAQKGTLQKCRDNPAAPIAPKIEALPEPPGILDEIGAAHWRDVTNQLDRLGILARADFGLLTAMCNEWAIYWDAEQQMRERSRWYSVKDEKTGGMRYAQIHPMETIKKTAFSNYCELAREFGLSPVARTRIAVDKKADEIQSPVARLLGKAI